MTTPSSLSKPIETALNAALKPRGFHKRKRVFWRDVAGLRHLIELQSSSTSREGYLRFTLNLGILCEDLLRSWDSAFSWQSCQWRERIGKYVTGSDHWWEVRSLEEAEEIAPTVARHLLQDGLPALEAISSRAELLDALERGHCPGLTPAEAEQYAKRLREALA